MENIPKKTMTPRMKTNQKKKITLKMRIPQKMENRNKVNLKIEEILKGKNYLYCYIM